MAATQDEAHVSSVEEVTGIPWYDASTYGRILEVMEDACLLPDTYEKWLCGAWDVWAHAQQNGDHPVKVHIDPNGFQEWCTAQGFAADSEARLEFAYLAAQAQAAETEILSPTASTCAPALERGGH
jgi:hypothetical protein